MKFNLPKNIKTVMMKSGELKKVILMLMINQMGKRKFLH
jgi:hypothetical protein